MKANRSVLLMILCIIIVIGAVGYVTRRHAEAPSGLAASETQAQADSVVDTHGMSEYIDPDLSFTFWYPASWKISTSTSRDTKQFPGGVLRKTIQIGPSGGVIAYIVSSSGSTITDEPDGHAAPINQTKYFYDASAGTWMLAYPEGTPAGSPPGTTTADVSHVAPSGLLLLPSGRRFDTSIVPLSITDFLVVSDGGGSNAAALTQTVALLGHPIASSSLSAILAQEAAAYASQ